MPPRFLLAGAAARGRRIEVVDLSVPDNDSDKDKDKDASLAKWAGKEGALVVIAPGSVDVDVDGLCGLGRRQLREAWRVWPHLSMEDPPRRVDELVLVAYRTGGEGGKGYVGDEEDGEGGTGTTTTDEL